MSRSYATPLAFKAALESRIGERARRTGRSINRVRQLLVMDRFLVRVFDTFESAVLKGGIVLELRLERARTTRDVDLRIAARADDLLPMLQRAVLRELGDFLSFEVVPHPDHPTLEAEGMRYEGQRYRVTTRLAGRPYGDAFGVDIAIGEPLVGEPQPLAGDDLLVFVGLPRPLFRAYPVETHIAEKLHAYTLPRPRPNSRVKDLPDLALLAGAGRLQAAALSRAISLTFAHRGTHPVPRSLPLPAAEWTPVYARMAAADQLPWGSLSELVAAVRAFLDPPLSGADGTWDPASWSWTANEP